jgi:cytochrome c oxidase cbb3-type subunit 3
MYKEVLERISGIGLYGVVSICIFFTFFTTMLLWVGSLRKNYIESMSTLPLRDGAEGEAHNETTKS